METKNMMRVQDLNLGDTIKLPNSTTSTDKNVFEVCNLDRETVDGKACVMLFVVRYELVDFSGTKVESTESKMEYIPRGTMIEVIHREPTPAPTYKEIKVEDLAVGMSPNLEDDEFADPDDGVDRPFFYEDIEISNILPSAENKVTLEFVDGTIATFPKGHIVKN